MGPRLVSMLLALTTSAWVASIVALAVHTDPVPLSVRMVVFLLTISMVVWAMLLFSYRPKKRP